MKSVIVLLLIASSVCSTTIQKRKPFELRRNPGARIIGGEPVLEASEFPFVAAIWITTSVGRYFCGGSVIDRQWILTAGRCVLDGVSFQIQLGSSSLTADDDNRDTITATDFLIHPEFDPDTLVNNIGLIHLNEELVFNDFVNSIALPTISLTENVLLTSLGWGQTDDQHSGPVDILQKVSVISLMNDQCKIYYGDQIDDSMVCAVGLYNEGTCIGDIGGPLVETSGSQPVLVGLASFLSGNGCESLDPSGYERTYDYLDWISSVTNVK